MNKTPKEQLINMAKKAGEVSRNKKLSRIEEYNKNPKLCKCCGKALEYAKRKNSFCSQSCATSYNNLRRESSIDIKSRFDNKRCKYCGGPLKRGINETYAKAIKKDYCCLECRQKHLQEQFIDKWKNGEIVVHNKFGDLNDRVRKYLLDKVGHKCERCGWSEVNPFTNRIPLQVHHIDGDHTNNTEENLQVLCPNCHSLTDTFGNANLGNGRPSRRVQ